MSILLLGNLKIAYYNFVLFYFEHSRMGDKDGEAGEFRTLDPLLARQMLYP